MNKQSGQTAVEYVILIAALSLIIISLSKKIKENLLGENGDCNTPETKSFICEAFSLGLLDRDGGYRRFTLRSK